MRRLPLHYRQVLVLHYGADLPVEQVAQQLRLPTGTVKSRSLPGPAPTRWACIWMKGRRNVGMHEDELHRQIAELVADNADLAIPPPIAAIRRRGRVAVPAWPRELCC